MPWHPLLTGPDQARALGVVREIADTPALIGPDLDSSGTVLLHSYLAVSRVGRGGRAKARRYLDAAIAELAKAPTMPSLYEGFAGVGWLTAHLQAIGMEPSDDDRFADIDAAVNDLLAPGRWKGQYDLIGGLVGFGVYALERLPAAPGRQILLRVLDRLEERAESTERGATWFTDAAMLPEWQQQLAPAGYYNLGVAHGMPGALGLLSAACAAGIRPRRTRALLEQAVRWLLDQRLPPGNESCFASWAVPGQLQVPSRTAWCYGDLGVAAILLGASRAIKQANWEACALEIARAAAARSHDSCRLMDAGLCHGSAGLGHLFNRLYQTTGDLSLADAARRCFDEVLQQRKPGKGVAGFLAYAPNTGTDHDDWNSDSGFLTGAAGIGLALLAAATSVEPTWDRVMLLSYRSASPGK